MSKKIFSAQEWENAPSKKDSPDKSSPISSYSSSSDVQSRVEEIISEIESRGLDIAHSYDEWVKLGFALASEFKEMGREDFPGSADCTLTMNSIPLISSTTTA